MKRQTATALLTIALCLGGCNRGGTANKSANATAPKAAAPAAPATSNAAADPVADVQIVLTPTGMEARQAGQAERLNFGSPADSTVLIFTGKFGEPIEDATNSECGAGPTRIVRWSNGFRILAQNGQFKGWETDQPGLNALGDLHVGMTRAQLEGNQASFEQTSLGTEWTVGDGDVTVSGLLSDNSPNGTVTHMWAGLTCHMT